MVIAIIVLAPRDYFQASGARDAVEAVAACEQALAEFDCDALAAELGQQHD